MYNPINTLADVLVAIHLGTIFVYIYVNYKSKILDYFFSLLLTVAISEGLKFVIHKPRPNLGLEGGSFPSTHTAIAFNAAFFILIACHRLSMNQNREGKWAFLFKIFESMTKKQFTIAIFVSAVTVGVLRIVTGAHYIEDVLAGATFGMIFSVLFRYYDVSARRLK